MPYGVIDDLPPSVRNLPVHAQEIFRAAFNSAWASYTGRGANAQEEIAFRVAWAAAKKSYRNLGDRWLEK